MVRAFLILAVLLASPVRADDPRSGYYYPAVSSEETFQRSFPKTPPSSRGVRVNFVNEITKAQLAAPDNPRFSLFAKGRNAQHMIVVALDDEIFRTLYRARAQLAQLTSNARTTDFFVKNNLQFTATWFDLAKLLGFRSIVVSDGVSWSHKIHLGPDAQTE